MKLFEFKNYQAHRTAEVHIDGKEFTVQQFRRGNMIYETGHATKEGAIKSAVKFVTNDTDY